MLTLHHAKKIAEEQIKAMPVFVDTDEFIIVDIATIKRPYTWIFFYNSKRYLETSDMVYAVAGNAPLFISKLNGHISTFSTGLTVEEMIEEFEEREKVWQLALTDNIYTDAEKLLDLKQTLGLSNSDIVDYKRSQRLVLDTGSSTRLSKLQEVLSDKNILTRLVERNLHWRKQRTTKGFTQVRADVGAIGDITFLNFSYV